VRRDAHSTDQPASHRDSSQRTLRAPSGGDVWRCRRTVPAAVSPPAPHRGLALIAVVLAAVAIGFVVFGRLSGGDLGACSNGGVDRRSAREEPADGWNADLDRPQRQWNDDSILGPAAPDSTTKQPAVYASVTCYGDAAATPHWRRIGPRRSGRLDRNVPFGKRRGL